MKGKIAGKLLLTGLLIIATGFIQEWIKVNVNYHLEFGERIAGYFDHSAGEKAALMKQYQLHMPYDYYHNHKQIEYMHQLSRNQLVALKWITTVVFAGIFLLLNLLAIKIITSDRQLRNWTIGLYLVFFVLSFAIYLFGKLIGHGAEAYAVSRKIVGALQSPVPLALLIPAWWLYKKGMLTNTHNQS